MVWLVSWMVLVSRISELRLCSDVWGWAFKGMGALTGVWEVLWRKEEHRVLW